MRRLIPVVLALAATVSLAAEAPKPHVLVTNDDGVDAPGIAALVDAIKDDFRVTVCAPADNQSGVGHGITYRKPVLVESRPALGGFPTYAIHAQPATCTRLGVTGLIADDPPVLVLSGINLGANTGRSTWVSGTVGGAREGALMGLPAIAFSAATAKGKQPDWAAAGRWAREVLRRLRAAGLPRPGEVVNVDIPDPAGAAKGIVLARVGLAPAREERYYEERPGPHGERLFVSRYTGPASDAPGTDVEALAEGWVAVTPLSLDQTDYRALVDLLSIQDVVPSAAAAK